MGASLVQSGQSPREFGLGEFTLMPRLARARYAGG